MIENNAHLMMQLCSMVSLQHLQNQNKLQELIPIAQRALTITDNSQPASSAEAADLQSTRLTAIILFREILIQASATPTDQQTQTQSLPSTGGFKLDKAAAVSYLQTFIPALVAQVKQSRFESEAQRVRLIVEAVHTLTQICEKFPAMELQRHQKIVEPMLKGLLDDRRRSVRKFARNCLNQWLMM